VVVVTVPSLNGSVLEEYATDMFRTYGLGDARLNNGVLLLVAMQEHQFRIEVGYGLEGAFTDGFCGRVRDKFLTPAFKQQDYNKGIREAYTILAARVAAEYKVSLSNLPPGTEKLVGSFPGSGRSLVGCAAGQAGPGSGYRGAGLDVVPPCPGGAL
jgi:uncharacterized membrane protein YgcG